MRKDHLQVCCVTGLEMFSLGTASWHGQLFEPRWNAFVGICVGNCRHKFLEKVNNMFHCPFHKQGIILSGSVALGHLLM